MLEQKNIIKVQQLCKNYNHIKAVVNLDLEVKQGEIFGFLGPNGSGKTTTIRLLCGLLKPNAGSGTCLGYDLIKSGKNIRQLVGYMPQEFSLYRYLTIDQNLEFVAKIFNIKNTQKTINAVIKRLELSPHRQKLAAELSGGWKQRLLLAAAIIHKPKLLLLDEPTAGVDPNSRAYFWEIITELANEGVTVLVSTHYMDEAERCSQIIYLIDGHKVLIGNHQDITSKAKLSTVQIQGSDILKRIKELRALKGVEQVIPYGKVLHISSQDHLQLRHSLEQYFINVNYECKVIKPVLEDVLIHSSIKAREKHSIKNEL